MAKCSISFCSLAVFVDGIIIMNLSIFAIVTVLICLCLQSSYAVDDDVNSYLVASVSIMFDPHKTQPGNM